LGLGQIEVKEERIEKKKRVQFKEIGLGPNLFGHPRPNIPIAIHTQFRPNCPSPIRIGLLMNPKPN
jgi:hypothetical protein